MLVFRRPFLLSVIAHPELYFLTLFGLYNIQHLQSAPLQFFPESSAHNTLQDCDQYDALPLLSDARETGKEFTYPLPQ